MTHLQTINYKKTSNKITQKPFNIRVKLFYIRVQKSFYCISISFFYYSKDKNIILLCIFN